jgi:hypothetical protein
MLPSLASRENTEQQPHTSIDNNTTTLTSNNATTTARVNDDERRVYEQIIGSHQPFDMIDPHTLEVKRIDPEYQHMQQLLYSKKSDTQVIDVPPINTTSHIVTPKWKPPYKPKHGSAVTQQMDIGDNDVHTIEDESQGVSISIISNSRTNTM